MIQLPVLSYVYLCIAAVALIIFGTILGLGWDLSKWKELFHKQPLKLQTAANDPERLQEVLKQIAELDMSEREIVLVSLFGRPVKILKCMSEDGLVWLHSIAPIEIDDTEYPSREEHKISYTG